MNNITANPSGQPDPHSTVRAEPVEAPAQVLAGPSTGSGRTEMSSARTEVVPPVALPQRGPLLTRPGWSAFMVALLGVCAVAPMLNLLVPESSVFHLSGYMVGLLGKIMCYAICALAMDLIWGYTGILSLGHGLFFALGGYVMGMYLMRQIGRDGNYQSDLPDFMVFLDWKELP